MPNPTANDRDLQALAIGTVARGHLTAFDIAGIAEDIPELRSMRMRDLLTAAFGNRQAAEVAVGWLHRSTSTRFGPGTMRLSWLFHPAARPLRLKLFAAVLQGGGRPAFRPVLPAKNAMVGGDASPVPSAH